ncbi:MAG: hypothetical protein J7L89_01000 [Bacteroidales bacterium]|nr:hypothetical protein [Bacteroidales bacterium]
MKVKTLKVTTQPKDGETEPFISQIINYDPEGRELANYQYSGPGIFESKNETKYDSNGAVIEEITYQDEHEIAERKTYTRDQKGEIIRIDSTFTDGSVSIFTFERDPVKGTENRIERDEDGALESRELLQFDEEGRIIRRELYNYRDKLTEAYTYEYNESGQLIHRRQLDQRGKLVIDTTYQYTETGLLQLRANRNRKGHLSDFIKMEYDSNGRVVLQNLSNKYFFEFEYDRNGNPIVEERYAGDELDNRTTFDYDEENRLLREEQPELIREYHYEFYESQ